MDQNFTRLLITFGVVLIVIVSYVTYARLLSDYEEEFISMALLGETQSVGNYYPHGNPNIGTDTHKIQWYIRIYNHMHKRQNITVKVKLINATLPSPNSTLCSPSPVPAILEWHYTLNTNETLVTPFFWQISDIDYHEDNVRITRLVINNSTITVNIDSKLEYRFRFIFELWVYDEEQQDYTFTRSSQQIDRCVWNQLWFNVLPSD